jgi:hypothetical protein
MAIDDSEDDGSETFDNNSDESETENETKTRAEDDEFLVVISTDVNFDCG